LERYFNSQFYKNKKTTTTTKNILLGVTENRITQKNIFLIFFKFDKLAEDCHLRLLSKPLEGDIICLENINF
jgi:hypothetical protein